MRPEERSQAREAEAAERETETTALLAGFERARAVRRPWEQVWRDCCDFTLPRREADALSETAGPARADRIFDGTAADAADQLAASMLAHLTPPWTRWFALALGPAFPEADRAAAGAELDRAAEVLQAAFDQSNFAVEMHQCFLDLVTIGTATLLFEEAPAGAPSAFRFTAVPMSQLYLAEGPDGRLDTVFRRTDLDARAFRDRFPGKAFAPTTGGGTRRDRANAHETVRVPVLETVRPDRGGWRHVALRLSEGGTGPAERLSAGRFDTAPFICFRWTKAPGEAYGRSPVMKALPDIRTANKVVELVLKNASIAVTGIWQADDDGVLNPANIQLVPGAIIPKAVGSSGLTPLEAPGRFDVSQLVLGELRARIRHALLADRLGQVEAPRMTATEVLERSAEKMVQVWKHGDPAG